MKISTSILLRDLLRKKRTVIERLMTIDLFENDTPQTVFTALKKSGVEGIELLLIKDCRKDDLQEAKNILYNS